jgi:hypothetical protein
MEALEQHVDVEKREPEEKQTGRSRAGSGGERGSEGGAGPHGGIQSMRRSVACQPAV